MQWLCVEIYNNYYDILEAIKVSYNYLENYLWGVLYVSVVILCMCIATLVQNSEVMMVAMNYS